jgi:cytochrome c553
MKHLVLGVVLSAALIGCSDKQDSTAKPTTEKPAAAADVAAGKAFTERECKGCHGSNGGGAAPAIPHLAGQHERYLLASLKMYKEAKRTHAALKQMAENMTDADVRNVAAYYAGLPAVANDSPKDAPLFLPYESGKALSAACAKCHNEDGNSTTPGTPSLAGQQPRYFVAALQEYLHRERKVDPMHALLPRLTNLDMESLALYFASQAPAQRTAPSFGDLAAGEPLTAVCGGCHGSHGVSADAATPTLAGQDARYLVNSTKAYRNDRAHEGMRRYVAHLADKDIDDIAAFYSVQKSKPAEKGATFVQELTEKCNRCHRADLVNPTMAVPKINGQDKDYLIMALRAYRDDRRESSMMHNMSLPYSDSIIESIASFYASQPAK